MDIEAFLSAEKSMIIAPAGYGKTYTIAEAIAAYNGQKKVLVLTHTHAGIASLREKFRQKEIPSFHYHLDTICSFALTLTKSYHINKEEIPSESGTREMFLFALERATIILKAKPIKVFLESKYDHLIVDEYQDCSVAQHQMILEIASTIKTHILGDPLQGIFGFGGEPIVDFDDGTFDPFKENCQILDTPWRWINAGNAKLGQDLAAIREKLIKREDINLSDYSAITITMGTSNDYAKPGTDVKKRIFRELNNNAVLIHPNSTNVYSRSAFVKQYHQLQLMESIDNKDYSIWCDLFDELSGQSLVKTAIDLLREVGKKTTINDWINNDGSFKNKQKPKDKALIEFILPYANALLNNKSYKSIVQFIDVIQEQLKVTIYRNDFYYDMRCILIEAEQYRLTASESLLHNRNKLRRIGRKVKNKSIGTTLLTKGLEFDNVVVINAQEFKDPKHLYVALTRCCQNLVVIADSIILHPYP